MKALGIEIKLFYYDNTFEFPKGEVEYDSDIDIDELEDNIKYELKEFGEFNYVCLDRTISFELAFKLWKKQRTTTTIIIEVEKSKLLEVMLLLKDNRIKVVK